MTASMMAAAHPPLLIFISTQRALHLPLLEVQHFFQTIVERAVTLHRQTCVTLPHTLMAIGYELSPTNSYGSWGLTNPAA